ncbi:alpha/beta fold hydrolase [Saccharospirillum sp.]|uniref:alpha/beta fold hydrolase n=1 Tax=Saccharospirillum sp. TaxID=2033801 RepID=UPI0034A0883F
MDECTIRQRNNVKVFGSGERTLMFAHGFGCDQTMWRYVTDSLQRDHTIITFDYVGSGHSDLSAFSTHRYATLEGYATDITEILDALELDNVILVGHSVSSVIGMIAAMKSPDRVNHLVMVCPSPYYLNDLPEYEGGFEREDLEELIDLMDKNYIGWANYLAPLVMGGGADTHMVEELSGSFCSTDPLVAKTFAKATFFSDHRSLLPNCQIPTLVLQSKIDSLASVKVGEYVSRKLPKGLLRILDTEGHCIHMTNHDEVEAEIRAFLSPKQAASDTPLS